MHLAIAKHIPVHHKTEFVVQGHILLTFSVEAVITVIYL